MDKKLKKLSGVIGVSTSLLLLSACGSSDTALQQGQLIDAAVAGVSYTTTPSGQSGTTDSQGNYNFLPGDKVTFKIGNIVFPSVSAKGTVTPLDIAGSTDVNNTAVVNIARLLQSLDSDSDTSNGITIDSGVTGSAYDFTKSEADFEAAFKADFPNLNLITKADAVAHLEAELANLNSGNSNSGTLGPNQEKASIPQELVGSYTLTFSETTSGSGFSDKAKQVFEVKADGSLIIEGGATLTNPVLYKGNKAEAIWIDDNAKLSYQLTDLVGKKFNEINVSNNIFYDQPGNKFYGQFKLSSSSGSKPKFTCPETAGKLDIVTDAEATRKASGTVHCPGSKPSLNPSSDTIASFSDGGFRSNLEEYPGGILTIQHVKGLTSGTAGYLLIKYNVNGTVWQIEDTNNTLDAVPGFSIDESKNQIVLNKLRLADKNGQLSQIQLTGTLTYDDPK